MSQNAPGIAFGVIELIIVQSPEEGCDTDQTQTDRQRYENNEVHVASLHIAL
tara:strand:- start:58 stop:213 length:156 start_codon:yes stop_codon:yes gene_type:complete